MLSIPATPPVSSTPSTFCTPVAPTTPVARSSHSVRPVASPDTPPFGAPAATTEPTTILDAYNRTFTTPTFSSTRMPLSSKRRTVFEMSMDIIDQRVRNINRLASARKNRSMSESDLTAEQDEPPASMLANDPTCAASSPQLNKTGGRYREDPAPEKEPAPKPVPTPRKRKLFAPTSSTHFGGDSPSVAAAEPRRIIETKTDAAEPEAAKRERGSPDDTVAIATMSATKRAKPTVVAKATAKKAPVANRRRTTMDFSGGRSKSKKAAYVVPASQPRLDKFLVSTNMHREQIAVIQEVGQK